MGRSRRSRKAAQFSIHRVLAHLDQRHPGLPVELREQLGDAIADRVWEPPVSLGKAVGIVLSTYARHERTDYDHLLRKHQLTRDEARLVVQAEHDEMLRSWSNGIDCDLQARATPPSSLPAGKL